MRRPSRALTTQNLRDYIAKYYQPQNMLLVVVGNVDPAEVLAEAEKMFAPYKNTAPLKEVMPYEPTGSPCRAQARAGSTARPVEQSLSGRGPARPRFVELPVRHAGRAGLSARRRPHQPVLQNL